MERWCANIEKQLDNDKVRCLIGSKGRNKRLLQELFEIKINVEALNMYEEESSTKSVEFKVSKPDKLRNFNEPPTEWARNVFKYVMSATRKGFIKWFDKEEYQMWKNDSVNYENFKTGLKNFSVDYQFHELLNGDVCLCILPQKENEKTFEKAIIEIGELVHARYKAGQHNRGSQNIR